LPVVATLTLAERPEIWMLTRTDDLRAFLAIGVVP
jgi:hypothetical protein